MSTRQAFHKLALSISDQILLLKSRGLDIPDETRAERYLKFIGYYHLGGYARHFMDLSDPDNEKFVAGSSFDNLIDLYVFDRKLRLIIFDAMERIEIAIKSAFNNSGCLVGSGAFWLTDANNFDYGQHSFIIDEITSCIGDDPTQNQNIFISHTAYPVRSGIYRI